MHCRARWRIAILILSRIWNFAYDMVWGNTILMIISRWAEVVLKLTAGFNSHILVLFPEYFRYLINIVFENTLKIISLGFYLFVIYFKIFLHDTIISTKAVFTLWSHVLKNRITKKTFLKNTLRVRWWVSKEPLG